MLTKEELLRQKEERKQKILNSQKARMALIQNTTEDKAHMPEEYHAAMRAAEAEKIGPVYNM